ncbi:MAG: SDR family oxidoreductase [Anaerolineae bacterium]|nr:MAG: SDR family oxidoreductase [Anaerolineae bacterium]
MARYLVTGGAGFIGSHIVAALLKDGGEVRVLDNFSTGRRENLDGLGDGLEILEGDLRDPDAVTAAVRDVDVVFHEAAFVSVPASLDDPQTCLEVNVTGTANLLEAARRAGVRRLVLASSAAVYGDSEDLPLSEETPPRPLSPYAASKLVDEIYAALYTHAFDLEVVALRYFNVFGPRQSPETEYAAAVPIFIHRLLRGEPVTIFGDGGQTRDLIYVADVVRANLLAAEHPQAPGHVFNICTGRETRLLDLVDVLMRLFPGAPQPRFTAPRPGDIYRSVGDPTRAAQVLGFRARTSLEEGLKETLAWMRK